MIRIATTIVSLFWASNIHAQLATHLFADNGESSLIHYVSDPLVLRFSVTNDAALLASQLNNSNQATLISIQATETFQALPDSAKAALSEKYSLRDVPVVRFDKQFDWQQAVALEVRDTQDQTWSLNAEVIELSDSKNGVVTLDGNQGATFKLAISQQQLAGLPQGIYNVAARLATPEESNTETHSNRFALELIEPPIDDNHQFSERWFINKTEYLLVVQNFTNAKEWATLWTSQYPANAQAWTALGDAEYGLGNNAAAISAYQESERQFRVKNGNQPQEIPELLIEKLKKARE